MYRLEKWKKNGNKLENVKSQKVKESNSFKFKSNKSQFSYFPKYLRGNTTVKFSKNHFFLYWLKKCFEHSKI